MDNQELEVYLDEIVELIKKTDEYKKYQNALVALNLEQELLTSYNDIMEEYKRQKKYEKYIDISPIKEEVRNINEQMRANVIVSEYYSSLNQLNDLLALVTKEIFQDLIDPSLLQPYFK